MYFCYLLPTHEKKWLSQILDFALCIWINWLCAPLSHHIFSVIICTGFEKVAKLAWLAYDCGLVGFSTLRSQHADLSRTQPWWWCLWFQQCRALSALTQNLDIDRETTQFTHFGCRAMLYHIQPSSGQGSKMIIYRYISWEGLQAKYVTFLKLYVQTYCMNNPRS